MTATSPTKRPRLTETLRSLGQPRVALMAALGFSSGLPFMLTAGTLGYWLRDSGVSLKAIGFVSWVGFAYSLKYLWSPVVDRIPFPLLSRFGQRRGWMLATQLLLAAGLVGMALTGPKAGLLAVAIGALIVAFASATQDIAIDALRIESAETSEELGVMTGGYQLGYRIAILTADAGILFAAQHLGWPSAYGLMAVLMGVGIFASFAIAEPKREVIIAPTAGSRLSRNDYWLFMAFIATTGLVFWGLISLLAKIGWMKADEAAATILVGELLLLLPFGLITARRCHDRGRSAWSVLIVYLLAAIGLAGAYAALTPTFVNALRSVLAELGLAASTLVTGLRVVFALGVAWFLVDLCLLKGSAQANRFGQPPADRPWLTVLWRTVEPVIGPIVSFGKSHGAAAAIMLFMIILYRLPEFVMGPMATPFYHDLGFSKDFVGSIRLTSGLAGTLAGMTVGGFLVATLGHARGLVLCGLLQVLAISSFALPALYGPDPRLFAGVMFMDNFGVGAAGVALVTYMSSLTSLGYTATQYAFMSSAYAWVGKASKGFSGAIVDSIHAHGHSQMEAYAIFFAGAGAVGLPGVLLCVWLMLLPTSKSAQPA